MDKVVSFISPARSVSGVLSTELAFTDKLDKALNDGFKVRSYSQQIINPGLFSSSKPLVLSTFILEKQTQ